MLMTEEELICQATVLRLAARLLRYPADGAGAPELAACARELAGLFTDEADEHALALEAAAAAERAEGLELERDYTALFIGAFEMLAPPYASYYLDGERRLGGASTVAVERAYERFGLVLAESRKQPGDHLATMCEFLFAVLRDAALAGEAAAVAGGDAAAGEDAAAGGAAAGEAAAAGGSVVAGGDAAAARADELVRLASDFFARYVRPWVGAMSGSVVSCAQTDFYRNLGRLLPLVLVEDSLLIETNLMQEAEK
ncbi:molecular chaperone [Adlercreutzia sp. ZJ242]|uniref:TorD/DmsD family molecular chaperone n=1 Tax=Adlercreutzia sp. ZJ242 TaxID=2709409 RepID=UPI0013EAD34B|nr:molecular chaperone TorD family protein [Adlercreutzia sp. ZJ242]